MDWLASCIRHGAATITIWKHSQAYAGKNRRQANPIVDGRVTKSVERVSDFWFLTNIYIYRACNSLSYAPFFPEERCISAPRETAQDLRESETASIFTSWPN